MQNFLGIPGVAEQASADQKAETIQQSPVLQHSDELFADWMGAHLRFNVLEARVADVLAVHDVYHVLTHVLGMIADALQRSDYPHGIEGAAN